MEGMTCCWLLARLSARRMRHLVLEWRAVRPTWGCAGLVGFFPSITAFSTPPSRNRRDITGLLQRVNLQLEMEQNRLPCVRVLDRLVDATANATDTNC